MGEADSSTVHFVRLAEEHLDEVMSIEKEAYPEPWSLGMFLEEIRSNRSFFCVLFVNQVLAGYGGFWLVLDEAHVTSVTVRDVFRGRGLGRHITRYLLDMAARLGARTATLEVRRSNVRARNLYHSEGFREVGIRKGYYSKSGEDAIVMSKELAPVEAGPETVAEEGLRYWPHDAPPVAAPVDDQNSE